MEIPMKEQAITFSLFALLIGFPVERIAQTESVFGSVLICMGASLRGRPFLQSCSPKKGAHGGTPLQIRTLPGVLEEGIGQFY